MLSLALALSVVAQAELLAFDKPSIAAVKLANKGKISKAKRKASQSTDPLASTLVEWMYLRYPSSGITYKQLMSFATKHPNWPAKPWKLS